MSHQEFEKAVSDLFKIGSLGLTKAEFDATPFGTSVQKIQDMIEKDMMVKVVEAHKANQIELDRLAKELQKCHDTKNSQVKTAKPSDDKYKKTSPLHKTCRTTEAGLYTEKVSCWEDEADKRKVRDMKCKEFRLVDEKYSNQNTNKIIVTKGGSEASESYLTRISSTICGKPGGGGKGNFGVGGFLDEFLIAKYACEKATKEHAEQKKKCEACDVKHAREKAKCNNIQDSMDLASCKYAVDIKDACEEYAECYMAAREAYDTT